MMGQALQCFACLSGIPEVFGDLGKPRSFYVAFCKSLYFQYINGFLEVQIASKVTTLLCGNSLVFTFLM